MTTEDKAKAAEETAPLPTRWQVSVHEAGHATYLHAQGVAVPRVTVAGIVAVETGAEGEYGESFGSCHIDPDGEESFFTGSPGIVLRLAGPVAAYRAGWPEPLPPDYAALVRYCEGVCSRSDLAQALVKLDESDDPTALYGEARDEAERFVTERWPDITRLAEKLMEAETLDESEVDAALGPGWTAFREYLNELRLADDAAPWTRFEGEEEEECPLDFR